MASTSEPGGDVGSLHRGLLDAQAKAARLDRWLNVLFATSPVALGIISVFENRYVRANPAMAELFGMSVEEILNSDPFSMALRITHPDELVAEQKLFAELVSGVRSSYRVEKRCMRPDGSFRWALLTFGAILDDPGGPAAPVGALHFAVVQGVDITDRKALAETLQRREAELRHVQKIDGIGRLAAGVAHDFNNLLTVIVGHGEMLKRRFGDGVGTPSVQDLQEDLEAILSAAERAADLTAQLLAYGRRERVAPRTLVLSDAVEKLQRLLGRILGSSIKVEQSLTAVGCIFADEGQIGQVVMNLLLNARDALAESGRIRIVTRDVFDGTRPGSGQCVALIVSDTGHGMSPEVQARMFEPFFTTRAERPGTQGTGLGLATVQRIVTEIGGRIDVESEPGDGTTVTVLFPRVESTSKEVERAQAPLLPAAAPNSQRILVVEDEPAVRSLIGTVLLGAHYWVMVARDGEEALRFIEAEPQPFHLIVTDLVMPSIGGVSLAERLHERASPPRMLFVSGYSKHSPTELSLYGNLLPKPFTPAQLLAAVSRALSDPS
ncbi:MAG: ATP-binding protein [Polyangiaceae bacterium]|jgi:two-component system, cell cycle sensor histidine kinase and response regulator CckA